MLTAPASHGQKLEPTPGREFGRYEAELEEEHVDRQVPASEKEPEPADNHLVQEYEAVDPDQDEIDDREGTVMPPGIGDGQHG